MINMSSFINHYKYGEFYITPCICILTKGIWLPRFGVSVSWLYWGFNIVIYKKEYIND